MTERFAAARARCTALVGRQFRSPKGGVLGTYVGVLERPRERAPVVVGKLPSGQIMHFTPSKAETLLVA